VQEAVCCIRDCLFQLSVILLTATVDLACAPTHIAANERVPDSTALEVQTLAVPVLPCSAQAITQDGDAILILDRCGTLVRWLPLTNEYVPIDLDQPPSSSYDVAANDTRIAVLGPTKQLVQLYDRGGHLVQTIHHSGDAHITRIVLLRNELIASSFFDSHLVSVYSPPYDRPIEVIENQDYLPEYSPRLASFVDVSSDGEQIVALDLRTFESYVLDAHHTVRAVEREPHPLLASYSPPERVPIAFTQAQGTSYTGTFFALAVALSKGRLVALMVDREDGRLRELVAAAIDSASWDWSVTLPADVSGTLADLAIAEGNAYLLDPERGVVYVLSLP